METSRLCLDTSILIGHLRRSEPHSSALKKALAQTDCFVTSVTVYELLYGLARTRSSVSENQLLSSLGCLPFDEPAARSAATLHGDLIRKNADIGIKDVMIAAICLTQDISLLTSNTRHFNRVTNLRTLSAIDFVAS